MKPINLFICLGTILLISIGFVSAFDLEKHLVQIEQDPNYPCHIENGDTIVCQALNNAEINNWIEDIGSIPDKIKDEKGADIKNPEKDKGKLKDNEKIAWLNSGVTAYKSPKSEKQIDLRKEYREKIKVNELDFSDTISIGFATNVFGVSGTPLENFDVNTTTGQVRYRPLNMTWLSFNSVNDKVTFANTPNVINETISFWINTSYSGTCKPIYMRGAMGVGGIRICNGLVRYSRENATTSPLFWFNVTSSTLVNNSQWHYITATTGTANGCNLSLYIDNVLEGNLANIGGCQIENGIGLGIQTLTPSPMNIDELRRYSRLLSPSEINNIYLSGRLSNSSLDITNLNIWLNFNQNSGTTIYDILGLKNGTITGATWQSDNINVTTLGYSVNISIANISNALIFWDNYTLINFSETSNRTFEFLNNQTIWILEDYKVNQTGMNANSPIWFSVSNSTRRHIGNNLSGFINATIIVNISCTGIYNLTYRTDLGIATEWYNAAAKSNCTEITTKGLVLSIENSTSSNKLEMTYDLTSPVITVVSPTATTYDIGTSIPIDFSATDVALDSLSYSFDGGLTNTTYTISTSVELSSDTYALTFYANDTSGNLATSSVTFKISEYDNLSKTFLKLLVGFLALGILVVAMGFFYLYARDNFMYMNNYGVINWIIIILITVILYIVLINYIAGLL